MNKPKKWSEIKADHDQQIENAAREYFTKSDRACYLYYCDGRLRVMADDENTEGLTLATGQRMRQASFEDSRLWISQIAGRLPYIAE